MGICGLQCIEKRQVDCSGIGGCMWALQRSIRVGACECMWVAVVDQGKVGVCVPQWWTRVGAGVQQWWGQVGLCFPQWFKGRGMWAYVGFGGKGKWFYVCRSGSRVCG